MSTAIVIPDSSEALFLDATTTQAHDRSAKVATRPVEGEGQVADHAETELESISVQGVVSDRRVNTITNNPPENRLLEVRQFLERAAEKRLRLSTLRFGVVEPVVLASWPHEIRAPLDSLELQLEFRVVRVAESEIVKLPPEKTTSPSLAGQSDQGSKATLPMDPVRKSKRKFLEQHGGRTGDDVASARTGKKPKPSKPKGEESLLRSAF